MQKICTKEIKDGMKFQLVALKALQDATEAYLIHYMEDMLLSAIHARDTTIKIQDLWLVK